MGYAITPKLGGPYVCAENCQHRDCQANRNIITSACSICSKSIGEDNKFYQNDDNSFAHAVCVWKQED